MKEFFHILILDHRTDPPTEHFYTKQNALITVNDLQSYFMNEGIRNLKTFKVWFAKMNFKLERFDSAPLYIEEETSHRLLRVTIEKGDKINIDILQWDRLI